MIAYKDCLSCLYTGKLSLLSQSYVVPFYSKRALQMYLQRWEPLLVHIQVVQQQDKYAYKQEANALLKCISYTEV